MTSTGNIFPTTGENNAGIGATAWTSPGNVISDNATDATCNAAASSQYLIARNFALSAVPVNATINGITVRVEASEHSASTESLNAQLQDNNSSPVGSSKANTISGTTKAVYTYGGTADVWGATLTPAIIHDADFGCRFWFTTSHDVRVDYVTLAVEYTGGTYGVSAETDTALALTSQKQITPGGCSESDTALVLAWQAGNTEIPTGLSSETDTALSLSFRKQFATGESSATDTSLLLVFQKQAAAGLASSTDTSLVLTVQKQAAAGLALGTDASLALTFQKQWTVGTATETDESIALSWDVAGGGNAFWVIGGSFTIGR